MNIEFDGLNELKKQLEDLSQRAQEMDGEHFVSFEELFPPEFLQEHTSMNTMQELMDKSGFKIETPEDFKAIPDDEWDDYIRKNTSFPDWETMMSEAVKEYTTRKLFGN